MIDIENSLILVIDIQEKLVNMLEKDTISQKAAKLLKAARVLGIPCIITEQYPRGLGETLKSLKQEVSKQTVFSEKTSFSAMREKDCKEIIEKFKKGKILVCGIETHVCVYQTVADLINENYDVEVIKDITASRNDFEFEIGIEKMKQLGATITSLETVLFELLKSSKHPNFKEIQGIIK